MNERVWRNATSDWQRPFAVAAGLTARGCSRRLQRLACDFALESPFGRATDRLREHHGVTLAPSTLRRLTLRHAGALRDAQLARPPVRTLPAHGAATLIAETDGTILPQVEFAPGSGDRRKRRKVVWKETRLCAVRAVGQTQTHYGVSCGDLAETAAQWERTAHQAGWAAPTAIHAVGDGAEWIARLATQCFGARGRCLVDLFHVGEYLAAAAPPDQPDYLARQKTRLCTGERAAVLAELAARLEPPATPAASAPVRAAHRYLANRQDQLDYPAALAAGLPVGSGLIESGHKHVLHHRLKISGAAWLRPNSSAIAHARVARANGAWPAYWDALALAQN